MIDLLTEFPALPRTFLRDFKRGIDNGFKEFSRSYGDAIETFFYPLLKFLVFIEQLLLATPWPIFIGVVAFLGYYFFEDRNADKAVKFNNTMATLIDNYAIKITSIDENDAEYFDKWASWNKQIIRELEYVPFYEGKKGVGYKLKESAIEIFNRSDVFIKDSVSLMNQIEKEASKVQNGKQAEDVLKNIENSLLVMEEDFEKDLEKLMNQFQELQKQYVKNNNLEFEKN